MQARPDFKQYSGVRVERRQPDHGLHLKRL